MSSYGYYEQQRRDYEERDRREQAAEEAYEKYS